MSHHVPHMFSETPTLPLAFEGGAALAPPRAEAAHRLNHKDRLRARFMASGPDTLGDDEMLELVLFRAVGQRDARGLARRLLDRFGDYNHVISAPPEQLAELRGVGDAVIRELKIVEASAHRLAQARIIDRPAISSWAELIDYCKVAMAHLPTEQFRILFLDRRNVLISDEKQQNGTIDHVPVYPREVVRRALSLNASAIILIHNHPSGDPTPSETDIDMTLRIQAAVDAIGITLHDHVVIGKGRELSFRSAGLL